MYHSHPIRIVSLEFDQRAPFDHTATKHGRTVKHRYDIRLQRITDTHRKSRHEMLHCSYADDLIQTDREKEKAPRSRNNIDNEHGIFQQPAQQIMNAVSNHMTHRQHQDAHQDIVDAFPHIVCEKG